MLNFVTTNPGKVLEAREYLPGPVEQFEYDYEEIQAAALGAIAAHGARQAYRAAGEPVFVDDSGLFVDALDGFPGPYSSYVEDRLGIERVWRLTEPEDDHTASFRAVVAYCDGEGFEATPEPVDREQREPERSEGSPDGERERPQGATRERRGPDQAAEDRSTATTDEQVRQGEDAVPVKLFEGVVPGEIVAPRGDGGFGYDPIFEHSGQTFAEMTTEEKNAVSHRGRALAKFAEWYAER